MKSFATLQDTFFTANSQRTLAEMQEKFDTEKKEKEILLLNKDKEIKAAEAKKQNLIIIFISIGLVLLAGLALIIYRSFKHSQKANKIISAQKKEVTDQKHLLQEKNTEILDSIHYAKRIQRALLTSNGYIKKGINKLNLDDSKSDFFILYKPKDIVSGDFYWALSKREKSINAQSFYLCTADCTGHGVPGAFMSLLGVSYLNEIIIEKGISSPDMVLNELRNSIIHALNPEQENSIDESVSENEKQIQDGMDAVLYKIESHDSGKKYLKYAAANNSFYVMRPNEENVYTIIDQKADKQPVGAFSEQKPFTLFEFEVFKNDIIISFTDGYADQFGGPKGKKIMYKKFEQLLISNAAKPMLNQKKQLDKLFMDWKANYEQIDDVLVIGVKI